MGYLTQYALATCVLATLMIGTRAFACSPITSYISEYLHNPTRVVFSGSVISIEERTGHDGNVDQVAGFYVHKWYSEQRRDRIVYVRGGRKWPAGGFDCGGFEFLLGKGQDWLITGKVDDGQVVPDGSLSREVSGLADADSKFRELPDFDADDLRRNGLDARLTEALGSYFVPKGGAADSFDWRPLVDAHAGGGAPIEYLWVELYAQDSCIQHGLARIEFRNDSFAVKFFISAPVIRVNSEDLNTSVPKGLTERVVELGRHDCRL